MLKKALGLVITAIIMLGVFGLAACNNDTLDAYKTEGKAAIETYAQERKDSYSEDNWTVVCGIVEAGKAVVDAAEDMDKVDAAVAIAKTAINAVAKEEVPSDMIKNGAYFITDTSWESYVRSWAKSAENIIGDIDEQWVQKAINGTLTIDDTDGLFLSPPIKSTMWVAVLGGRMTVSGGARKIYSFSRNGDSYTGEAFNSVIQFTLINEVLTISADGIQIQYLHDTSYQIADSTSVLATPTNIEYASGGVGLNFVFLQWNYTSDAGFFGAGIEVRQAGQQDFVLIKIEQVYHNSFVIQFERADFTQGINTIRIRNIGGPILSNNPKQVSTSIDSEYTVFNIIIDAEGNVAIEKAI